MRKPLYLLLLAVWFAAFNASAQKSLDNTADQRYSLSQKKYTFAIQPFQLLNWSLRFDFEMRLGDGPGWLQFGPAVYYSFIEDSNSPDYYYDGDYHYDYWGDNYFREPYSTLRGGGLDINYKRFVNPARSFYVAAGLSYARLNVKYWGRVWNDYTEDGLEYHEYGLGYQTQHINRLGVNTYVGYQIPFHKAFLFDMFIGLAYRYSFYDENKQVFDESMFSYGYRGLVFMTGVRMGFGIR